MSNVESETRLVELHVENIGGIDETTVELTPGVTVLTGRNATNRTSLLQALMAALGSDRVSLKADADEGRVELAVGDRTFTRTIRRQNGTTVTEGDPYLEDATLADLFAFLLESNEARRAVARGDDLRSIIMRPIDTSEIESQISERQEERERIQDEIDEIDELERRVPAVEERKSEIEAELASKREELSEIQTEIEDKDAEDESQIEEKQELEEKLDELSAARSDLGEVRHRIDAQRDSIEALEEERDEVQADFEDYAAVPAERVDDLEDEIRGLRSTRTDLDETIDQLQTVIQFNETLVDGGLEPFADLQEDDDPVTAQLLETEQDLTCWTCGSDVTTGQIETMLDRFRELRDRHVEQRSTLDDEISELRGDQSELEERQRQRRQLQTRLQRIEDEIADREEGLERLRSRREELTEQVETLEAAVESLRADDDRSELIDLHSEASAVEVEIERLETNREEVIAEIERIEERIGEREAFLDERETLQAEIEDLRTKIDRIERSAIEQFNDHMDVVLDVLEYDNLERIWLERTEGRERDGRGTVTTTHFEMHVVRSTDDGTVYEDQVDHLSESEREVTGLVFALAGYLAHDLHERLPFMLLDSVEAIDPSRLSALVDYLTDYPDHFVAALLEDDARVLDDAYQRVTDI